MKISRRDVDKEDKDHLRAELEEILCPARRDEPVCDSACNRPEGRVCSRSCPDMPRTLSSEGDKYTLETRIAPLVYELKRFGIFEPCWSCEGHNGTDGTLWKIPRVWFYSKSVVHVRVLADSIAELHVRGKLNVPWHIAITHSDDDNADTTFSLEPAPTADSAVLSALQSDVDTIARHLGSLVIEEARKLSTVID